MNSLRFFSTQRADLLAVLELLPADGLARRERPHLKQIERILNTMHM